MDDIDRSPMARPPLSDIEFRRETNDRLRRMETRLTKFMEWMGFDTEVRRPEFYTGQAEGRIDLPSDATSLRDILAVVPSHWTQPVVLVHKGVIIGTFTRQ